jgi:hypothetical protein
MLSHSRGSVEEVEKAINREFAYQSQLELGEETNDAIQRLPTVRIAHSLAQAIVN